MFVAAVVTLAALAIRAAPGAPAPPLAGPRQVLWRDGVKNAYPRWSKDGSRILYQSNRGGAWQIFVMDRDGADARRLVTSGDDDTCARVSPDGRRILYLANLAAGRDDVMMRRRDGSDPVNVTDDAPPDGWPTWTPDGAHIVYASRRDAAFALYTMRSDGSDARRLTVPPEGYADARPSVSADGRHIVFNRERGDTIGIYVVDVPSAWWRAPAAKEAP